MDMNWVMPLDIAHQLQIPLEWDVGVMPALKQNLNATDRLALVDLGSDLLEAQDIAFCVFGPAVERAEFAVGNADVRVVDVPVDDIGDHVLRVLPPPLGIGQLSQLQQRGALVELEIILEFT